ncbi:MAG: hypothetical protein IJD10_00535 [Clostridia bacterium]|nr:hypothetical protein [Clostridia bacterium]
MNEKEIKTELLSEAPHEGTITVKRNKIADFIAKIGCLVLAFFLWYYAASTDTTVSEETFTSIPVTIINESGFAVLSGDDVTVDVRVSGKRSLMNKISADDIVAYVEMSSVTEAGKHQLPLQFELPNGVTLEKASLSSVTLYAGNMTTVSVPVKVEITNYMLEDSYELGLGAITTDIRQVTVTGPESILSRIDRAVLAADIGHVTRTVTYSGDIKLVDADGKTITDNYVTVNHTAITATIPVYKHRDVPIEVTYKHGYFNETNCAVMTEPATIRIRGEADVVDAVKLSYEIDEKSVSGEASYSYGLSLPATVENLSGAQTVTVSVKPKGMSTRTVSIFNLNVSNPAGLSYELAYDPLIEPLRITLYGETALVSRISTVSITATLDLSGQSGTGTVNAPVTIRFADAFAGKVYELGSYTVQVRILG